MSRFIDPLARAIGQIDDPVFLGVLWRSLAWSAVAFAAITALAVWAAQDLLSGWHAWAVGALGGAVATMLAFWLFLPVAAVIGTFYMDRIARAVERRWYPDLPPAEGEGLGLQIWDGVAVGLRILGFNIIALILALLLPGIGVFLGWAIAGWAIGRGMFVAVAMRRMRRREAEALYRQERDAAVFQGTVLALAGYVPGLNLLIPLIGTAAMVHVLDRGIGRAARDFAKGR